MATPAPEQLDHDMNFVLDVRQQPRQARSCGSGDKADRRPIDPPPIIRLRVRKPPSAAPNSALTEGTVGGKKGEGVDASTVPDAELVPPTVTHSFFMFASLIPEDSEEEQYMLSGSKTKHVTGSVVSSLFHLKDQSCFVFPDLSVRTEGRWRFKMSMYEILEDGVRFCTSILTDTFQVYSSKRFPGMSQSTTESREAAAQGLRLRIRRPKKAEEAKDSTSKNTAQNRRAVPSPPPPAAPTRDDQSPNHGLNAGKRFSESAAVPFRKRPRVSDEAPSSSHPYHPHDHDPRLARSATTRSSWPAYGGWAPPDSDASRAPRYPSPDPRQQYHWSGPLPSSGGLSYPPPLSFPSTPRPSLPPAFYPREGGLPHFSQPQPYDHTPSYQYHREDPRYQQHQAPAPSFAPIRRHVRTPSETSQISSGSGRPSRLSIDSTASLTRPSSQPTPSRSPDQQWERRLPPSPTDSRYVTARLAESSVRTEEDTLREESSKKESPPPPPSNSGRPGGSLAKLLGEESKTAKEITSVEGLFF